VSPWANGAVSPCVNVDFSTIHSVEGYKATNHLLEFDVCEPIQIDASLLPKFKGPGISPVDLDDQIAFNFIFRSVRY
jgi:hypothetical protein